MPQVEKSKFPYEKDGFFYSLWIYANADKIIGKSAISFLDIQPPGLSTKFSVFLFLKEISKLKIELEGMTFHKEIYKKYYQNEHSYIVNYIKENPEKNISISFQRLFNNDFSFDDILVSFDFIHPLVKHNNGVLEFFEFSPNPSIKNINPLIDKLDTYIQLFIEDRLFSLDSQNFYKFSNQKKLLLSLIEENIKKYGSRFSFKGGNPSDKNNPFLLIHTLVALEKQGFFEVENVFITDTDIPPEDERQCENYKITIRVSEKLVNEIDEPNYSISFDEEKGILCLGKNKIKTIKFSDQYHLLRILFENQDELHQEWFFSDIGERVDHATKDPDKKYYNASYQIKKKIELETGIKDFFTTTRQSLRINNKYYLTP